MSGIGVSLLGALLAAACSALTIPPLLRWTKRRGVLIDRPNPRSSHSVTKTRGGGVAVLLGIAAGWAAMSVLGADFGRQSNALLLGSGILAILGFWDDLRTLPVWPRLLVQSGVALAVAVLVGSLDQFPLPAPLNFDLGPLAIPVTVVWLVGVTNFFNFMDGVDGLAAGQAVAVGLGVGLAAWSGAAAAIGCLLVGAAAGFLPYNWWPSRVFLGDVGSLPLGFLLAGLPLLAPAGRRSDALFSVGVAMMLFLLDPAETLVRRWRRGARVGESHRDHSYQMLVAPGQSHAPVVAALVGAGVLLSAMGALAFHVPQARWFALAAGLLVYLVERSSAKRAAKQRSSSALPHDGHLDTPRPGL